MVLQHGPSALLECVRFTLPLENTRNGEKECLQRHGRRTQESIIYRMRVCYGVVRGRRCFILRPVVCRRAVCRCRAGGRRIGRRNRRRRQADRQAGERRVCLSISQLECCTAAIHRGCWGHSGGGGGIHNKYARTRICKCKLPGPSPPSPGMRTMCSVGKGVCVVMTH